MLATELSRRERLPWPVVALGSLAIACIFGLRDTLILFSEQWPHLYATVHVPLKNWEEVVAYLPFVTSPSVTQHWLMPPLSMGLYRFLFSVVAQGSPDLFLWGCHTLLPVLSFWLVYLIFRLFIDKTWSICLAFLGLTYYSDFSSAHFLLRLLSHGADALSDVSTGLPEIARTPFPALSFPLFAAVFYLTLRSTPTPRRVVLLAVLWSAQIYVYAFNFIAGMAFFLPWLLCSSYFMHRSWSARALASGLLQVSLVTTCIAGPYLANVWIDPTAATEDFVRHMAWASREVGFESGSWGFALSYLLPLVSASLTIVLFRGDYYELLRKFAPVLIAIGVDLCVGNLHLVMGRALWPQLLHDRISGILFRFFYFVPLLYFVRLPIKASRGPEAWARVRDWLHGFLQQSLIGFRVPLCAVGMSTLVAVLIIGSLQGLHAHEQHIAPVMARAEAEVRAAQSLQRDGGAIAFESLEASLLAPVLGVTPALTSVFHAPGAERLRRERLELHRCLFRLDPSEFAALMRPDPRYAVHAGDFGGPLTQADLHRGLGHWLLHNQRRTQEPEASFSTTCAELVRTTRAQGVRTVVATRPIFTDGDGVTTRSVGAYYVSTLED